MRTIAIAAIFFCWCSSLFAQQQTQEQKFLMDRHKKIIETEPYGRWGDSFGYLIRRRASIGFVEDKIIQFGKEKSNEKDNGFQRWLFCVNTYMQTIPVEDTPDRMIPEFAKRLAMFDAIYGIEHAAEFGPRGKAFLPVLETIRDKSREDRTVQAAIAAIAKITTSK